MSYSIRKDLLTIQRLRSRGNPTHTADSDNLRLLNALSLEVRNGGVDSTLMERVLQKVFRR